MLTTITETKEKCRFDMFTRRKKESLPPVKNAKEVFTYRGDQYKKEPDKMLQHLISIVENYRKQFVVMMLCDHTKPKNSRDRIILKVLHGIPRINRLCDYPDLLKDYPLPEWLSYEIKD